MPHQDSAALAAAIRLVLTRPSARPSTPSALLWPAVAHRYDTLARRLVHAGAVADGPPRRAVHRVVPMVHQGERAHEGKV
ncbi:hypothetical protein [Virgisporangium ochraceum]|uniref:hypothetical protein n=1 Tax=Virgisporangium ochraceum TaxID=65505 RepID=UPI0019421A0C|nr:hypothetical protein [Virgisporangium ochraceum]